MYTYELVRALAQAPGRHQLVVFARPGLFDDIAAEQRWLHVVHVAPSSRLTRLVWEQTALPFLLRRLRVDVLHSPHHHTPLLPGAAGLAPLRRVVTFHDVTFLILPERYPAARRLYMEAVTRASARVADGIITPSETVRHDVIERLGVSGERVVVISEAPSAIYRPAGHADIDRVRAKYGLPERYVLSVGSLEPGKNRARLVLAHKRLRQEGLEYTLAIVGQPAWRHEGDYELVRSLGLGGGVMFLGYVPDEDLPALYSGAALLAFPSLYEGFGLPILEAMACGTPVVTSNVSATAEVASDAALLVDPRDPAAIAEAMRRLLADREARARLRERGLARAAEFSWQRAARDTLSVYEVVAALRR